MAKISEDCLKEAYDALRNFSKDELEDYVRAVFVRAKEIDPLQGARAMTQAEKEINDAKRSEYFNDSVQKAKNIMAFEQNAKPIREGLTDFRGITGGKAERKSSYKKAKGENDWRKRNVTDSVKAEIQKVWQRVLGDLTHEEVEHLASGKYDQEICDVIDGKETKDPFTKKIAEKFKDYWAYTKTQLILSGAMKPEEFHPKRFFSQVHDQQKIINAGESWIKNATSKLKMRLDKAKGWWRNIINEHIDQYETFKNTDAVDTEGNVDQAAADKIIDRTFNNITTNRSQIFTRSAVANDREAVARKSKMFFVWKSFRDQYEYNKKAGSGNLFAMLMRDIQSSSQKIGTAKVWGDNIDTMYNDLKKVQEEVDPKGETWWKFTDNYFKSVMRLDRGSVSPNSANFWSNLRTATTIARLPLITADSVSDIGYISSFASRHGDNYFKAWGYHLTHLFNAFPSEDRKEIARLISAQVDSHIGFMGRWANENNTSAWLNKISTGFFKLNLLEAFDKGNKVGTMTLMAKRFFTESNKSWDKLPEATRTFLDRFIDSKEWDLLRNKSSNSLFTTDNVDNLTESELRAHYQTTDKSMPLSEVRDDLWRRVYAMFTVGAENSVLAPGDFERAFVYRGTQAGDKLGELTRAIGQFKMYTIAFIDRVLIDGLRNADGVQQKLMWATSMLMGTLPLSYLGMWAKNALLNKSMPDPDYMSVPEREQYYLGLLAPSLGMFAGLLDPRNQNAKDLLASIFGSPSISLILNAVATALPLASGNTDKAYKQAKKTAGYFAPLQTTPIISPILQYVMGDQAYLEPGQHPLIGQ